MSVYVCVCMRVHVCGVCAKCASLCMCACVLYVCACMCVCVHVCGVCACVCMCAHVFV